MPAKKDSIAPVSSKKHYRFPVGFFAARRNAKKLADFEALVKYYFNKPGDTEGLKPLKDLIKDYDQTKREAQIREAINKKIFVILTVIKRIGASVKYEYFKPRESGKTYFNSLLEIFFAPEAEKDMRYTILVDDLQRVRGWYEARSQHLFWSAWKPTLWCAWLINLPARVLRDTGVDMENEKTSKYYYLLLQILTGILLTLFIVKLGIELELSKILIKWLHIG